MRKIQVRRLESKCRDKSKASEQLLVQSDYNGVVISFVSRIDVSGRESLATNAPPSSLGAQTASGTFFPSRAICPLWRRFLAYLVDSLILYLVGRGIGAAFFNTLSQLGSWGRLIGFCIAVCYFASLDSGVGNGQTVGKRLLRITVVGAQGNTISLARAALRFTVFAIPSYLYELQLPRAVDPLIGSIVLGVIVFGVGGSTLYLLIFNRNTRQGLHDLVAGSYVVNSEPTGPLRTEPIWDTHWRILRWYLTLLVLFSCSIWTLDKKMENSSSVIQWQEDVRLIEQLDRVQAVREKIFKPLKWNGFMKNNPLVSKKTFVITVWWTGEPKDREVFADRVAKLILLTNPRAHEQDLLWIVVVRGYNIGIASGGKSETFKHTPAEWSQRVLGTPLAKTSAPPH